MSRGGERGRKQAPVAAGLGVAMGNALAAVKAAADRIAPRNDEDGLAAVVGWLLEGGARG